MDVSLIPKAFFLHEKIVYKHRDLSLEFPFVLQNRPDKNQAYFVKNFIFLVKYNSDFICFLFVAFIWIDMNIVSAAREISYFYC